MKRCATKISMPTKLAIVLFAALASALIASLLISNRLSTDVNLWPAPPIEMIPYLSSTSDLIVLGSVISRANLVEGRPSHYSIILSVEKLLKGSCGNLVEIRIEQKKASHPLYSPQVETGERILLFADTCKEESSPVRYRVPPFEARVWRVEGDIIYNEWSMAMKRHHSRIVVVNRMPRSLREHWGRSFALDYFCDLVSKSIEKQGVAHSQALPGDDGRS